MDTSTRSSAKESSTNISQPIIPPLSRRLGALLFVSGFCSLVYLVACFRLLRLLLGPSTAAFTVMLAVLIAALGFGGVWIARRSRQAANRIALFAKIEVGITVAAATSPLLADLSGPVVIFVGGSAGLGYSGTIPIYLLIAAAVLGPAAFLMGGSLPVATQALASSPGPQQTETGRLVCAGCLGAVTGVAFASFVSIEFFGVRNSLWLACLIRLLMAMAARSLARRSHEHQTHGSQLHGSQPYEPRLTLPVAVARFVIFAIGLSSFAFFAMIRIAFRQLNPLIGGSLWAHGLILAAILLGVGIGSYIYAFGIESRSPNLRTLALTNALLAVFMIIPFATGDITALTALMLRPMEVTGFWGLIASWFLITSWVVLPISIIVGYQFSLSISLLGNDRHRVGQDTGLIFGASMLGALLGLLCGGPVLTPWLGAHSFWRALVIFLISLTAITLVFERGQPITRRRHSPAIVVLLLGVAGGLLFADGPSAFGRLTAIGAGRVNSQFKSPNGLQNAMNRVARGVVAELEGVQSTVTLTRDDGMVLIVGGHRDSFRRNAGYQIMGAMIGTALHPQAQKVLVIGFGTGITAGWLAQVPSVERVDVVELEPSVVRIAQHPKNAEILDALSLGAMQSPKVKIVHGGARQWLLNQEESYDLIVAPTWDAFRPHAADELSQTFYRIAAERLSPGGFFLQGLQSHDVDPDIIQGTYATLKSVFPAIDTWQTHAQNLLLVASTKPLIHPIREIGSRIRQDPWRKALRRSWGVEGLEGLYSGFVANDRLASALAEGSTLAVSTDDRPSLEFALARRFDRSRAFDLNRFRPLAQRLDASRPELAAESELPLDWDLLDWDLVEELAEARPASPAFTWKRAPSQRPPVSSLRPEKASDARAAAREAWAGGDLAAAAQFWPELDGLPMAPLCFLDRLMLAELRANNLTGGDPTGSPTDPSSPRDPGHPGNPALPGGRDLSADREPTDPFLQLEKEAPIELELFKARLSRNQNRIDLAAGHIATAFELMRQDPWVHATVVDRGFQLAKELAAFDPYAGKIIFDAMSEPFAGMILEKTRSAAQAELAGLLDVGDRCREIFERFEPYPIWNRRFLEARVDCYFSSNSASMSDPLLVVARKDLTHYLNQSPPELEIPDPIPGAHKSSELPRPSDLPPPSDSGELPRADFLGEQTP